MILVCIMHPMIKRALRARTGIRNDVIDIYYGIILRNNTKEIYYIVTITTATNGVRAAAPARPRCPSGWPRWQDLE